MAYALFVILTVLACIGLLCIALAPKPPLVEDDQITPEVPYLPAPIIVHLSIGDRERGRASHDKDFEARRFEWAAWAEAQELIRDVEEGV